MDFTGNNTLILPQTRNLLFFLNDIAVSNTGIVNILFSDISGNKSFEFILSGQNVFLDNTINIKNLSTYNLNEFFSISGQSYIDSDIPSKNKLDYFINDIHINNLNDNVNPNLGSLSINVCSGNTVSSDIQLYCDNINLNINFPTLLNPFTSTIGTVLSDTNLWFFGSNTTFYQSYQTLLGIDTIIMPIYSGYTNSFNITDLDDSFQDYTINITTIISSNLGDIFVNTGILRTGILNGGYVQFNELDSNYTISGEFDGTWANNQFTFDDTTEYNTSNFYYYNTNASGEILTDAEIFVELSPVYPNYTGLYQSIYVTGFNLTNSGTYLSPPDILFTGYYFVTGIQQQLSSMLFSNGCTGNIPVIFSGGGGSGASGTLSLFSVVLNNVYQSGQVNYNIVTNFEIASGGNHYLYSPIVTIETGIYSNCYDVPNYYGYSYSVFSNVNTYGVLSPQSFYLTGLVQTTTGFITSGQTGYFVTGLDITNLGSGYSTSNPPLFSFIRQSGDNLTNDASGILLMKTSGIYDFINMWSVQTGYTNTDYSYLVSGTSGNINTLNQYFSIIVSNSGIDNTEPIIVELTLTPPNAPSITKLITGYKYYDTDPYFLKKKIDINEILIPSGTDLSFLLTQDDLDTYYSGPDFTSDDSLNIGDLDF